MEPSWACPEVSQRQETARLALEMALKSQTLVAFQTLENSLDWLQSQDRQWEAERLQDVAATLTTLYGCLVRQSEQSDELVIQLQNRAQQRALKTVPFLRSVSSESPENF